MILSAAGTTAASNKLRNSPLKESRQLIERVRRLKEFLQVQRYVPNAKVQVLSAMDFIKPPDNYDFWGSRLWCRNRNGSSTAASVMDWAICRRFLIAAWLCGVIWILLGYNPMQEVRRTMQPEQVLQELDAAFRAVPVSLYNDPHHFKVADARLTVLRAPSSGSS